MSTIEQDTIEATPQAKRVAPQQYRHSTWVHVGAGAESCEDVNEEQGTSACSNPAHFHAYCRLPNQFQHKAIREKALAAQARKMRQLRDPDSDSSVILDSTLDALREGGEEAIKQAVDELVARERWRHDFEAMADLAEIEDTEGEKVWAHIEADRERYGELMKLPEPDRPADEWGELETRLDAYDNKLEEVSTEKARPLRESLEAKEPEEIIALIRRARADGEGLVEYQHVYAKWEWLECTLRHKEGPQMFASIDAMLSASPEVIYALKDAYEDIEVEAQRAMSGNA